MVEGKYDRLSEARLPLFGNHRQARLFFKNRHGDDFMLIDSQVIDNQEKVYFYDLVLDRETYQDGTGKLRKGEIVTGLDFLNCFQRIEIFEDGRVHVIH